MALQDAHASQNNRAPAPGVFWRLCVMMALQWGSLGLWAVTLPTYLAANTGELGSGIFGDSFIGDVGIAGALGALLSPVVCGLLVDRWFNTEIVIAGLHGLSALLLTMLSYAESQTMFFILIVAYFQAHAPTGALLSSLALRRLPDSARHFSQARAAGTAGWMVAGALVGLWPLLGGENIEPTTLPMRFGVVAHLMTAVFSLTLPATPPTETGVQQRFAGAGGLWGNRRVLLFLTVSVLASTPAKFYDSFINQFLNHYDYSYPAFLQTIGQASEVAVMLLVPLFLSRFRLKGLFLVGILCWVLRFALLAYSEGGGRPWMVYAAMGLHGFSFVFVFILGQLYIDWLAPADSRGAAQGLHVLATFGLGALIGARLSGWAQSEWLTPDGVSPAPYDWQSFWLLPCVASLLAAVLFGLLFNEAEQEEVASTAVADAD